MFKKLLFNFYLILILFVNFIFSENLIQTKNENNNKQNKTPGEIALCEGSTSAFFVSDNINIIDNIYPSSIIRGINEQKCIEYCKNNKDKNGRTLLCSLIVYRNEIQECRLYKRTTFPDGDLIRQTQEGYRLIEKFCLEEEISMECSNKQFIRVDNYILRGYAQSTTTVPTLALCVNECIKEKEFNCLSAMYFYEEGECITNTESAITAPDDFQPPEEDDKKVVFFHNSCIINNKEGGKVKENLLFNSDISGNNNQLIELLQSQDSTIKTTISALIQDEINTTIKEEKEKEEELINSSIPTTTLLPLNKNINNLNNNTLQATEYNNTSSFLLENNLNNNLFNETTTQINKKEINKLNNNINPSIISSSVFVSPEKGEEEENKIILPKVFLPQKDEVEKINNNLNKEIKEQQQQQRQYGAKIIERASDGSFQEKITKINSSSLLPISSSNSLLNNNNPIKSTIFNNKKGAESTKKLHLKLIKDLNQKTNINNIITTTTSLPLNNNLLTTTNFNNNLIKEKINKKHENKQIEEFIPKLELEEPLNNDQSVEEHFEGSEGYFSLWGPWTPCTIPGERKIRRRKCLDLRKCRGSLTQVDYCSINNIKNNNEEEIDEEEEKINNKQNNDLFTTKNDLIIEREEPKPPGITPPPSHEIEQNLNNKQQKQFGILTSKNENNEEIWSKWNGTCQHFASSQPCKDGQVIGFESRECIAKDPLMCKGPFFRYCTLPC